MRDRLYTLVFLLISLFAFFLIQKHISSRKFYPHADEGYYLGYASYISTCGFSGFKDLSREYISNKRLWLFPDPFRIGAISLSALWVKIFRVSFLSLAHLSLFSFFLLLLFWFYFTKKYFSSKIALLSGSLLAFSPLSMGMAGRALIDSLITLFLTLSIWLFFDYLERRGRIRYIIFILVYSFAILIKQIAFLLVFPFFLYLIIRLFFFKTFRLRELFLIIAPLGIVFFVWIVSTGLFCTIEMLKIYLIYPHPDPSYRIAFCSGPWFKYIIDLLLLSPLSIILFLGYIFSRKFSKWEIYLLLTTIILFFLIFFLTKNIRNAMVLDGPIRLGSILMLSRAFEGKFSILLWFIVAIIGVYDLLSWHHLFIRCEIYDPVTFWLLKGRGIIKIP